MPLHFKGVRKDDGTHVILKKKGEILGVKKYSWSRCKRKIGRGKEKGKQPKLRAHIKVIKTLSSVDHLKLKIKIKN